MAIYTQKCEQKLLKINKRMGWNRCPGRKKIEKLTIREDDYSGLESTPTNFSYFRFSFVFLCDN